jgi:hypothetical protein
MIDDQLVLRVERLRDAVESLHEDIRSRYSKPKSQVVSRDVRDDGAKIAERWLVEISSRSDVRAILGDELLADLTVEFQRLIRFSEASTIRSRYDSTLRSILRDFRNRVVIPLKQNRGTGLRHDAGAGVTTLFEATTAFVGQSFAAVDDRVNHIVRRFLEAMDIKVVTGEKPAADSISAKVRRRIEGAQLFVGVFTRRDRIAGRQEWSTSTWIVDEKAYALARDRKLVLIKEEGVQSIGGLQGDYEYIEFRRDKLESLVLALLETFKEH